MPTVALLDIGHTRVKMATASSLDPFDVERVQEWDTHGANWASIAAWTHQHVVADELRCCCVVHAWLDGTTEQALEELFGMSVHVMSVGEATEYDPQQLGVDRYLLAHGAASYYPETAVVISAGTTITVDVVGVVEGEDEAGEVETGGEGDAIGEATESSDMRVSHLGGWILPGARVVEQGYKGITPHFPSITLPGSHAGITIPSNTTDATQEGLALMITSIISRIIEEFEIEVVFFTGGDGALLRDLWETQADTPYDLHVELVPDLLFYGMMGAIGSRK